MQKKEQYPYQNIRGINMDRKQIKKYEHKYCNVSLYNSTYDTITNMYIRIEKVGKYYTDYLQQVGDMDEIFYIPNNEIVRIRVEK